MQSCSSGEACNDVQTAEEIAEGNPRHPRDQQEWRRNGQAAFELTLLTPFNPPSSETTCI